MDWSQTALQPDFMRLFWGYYRTPEAQRNEALITTARKACERHFEVLDARLESQPFVGGERFTMADIPAGTALYRYFEMGLPVARPSRIEAWFARLAERPAYREHVMVPFRELCGRLGF